MKLYKCLALVVLLGIGALVAHASPTSVDDPGVALSGGHGSTPVVASFTGSFPPASTTFKNDTTQTFDGLLLIFTGPLTYSCADVSDPFFSTCLALNNDEIEFFGTGPGFPGIGSMVDFSILISGFGDNSGSYAGTAFSEFTGTPEPASALLFLSGLGMMAGFLKRRSKSVAP